MEGGGGIAGMLGAFGAGALGTLFVKLTADATHLVRGMHQAELTVATAAASIGKHAKLIAGALVGAFATIGILGVHEFAKFEKAMVESTAIMGDLSDEMVKEMEHTARSMSEKTIQSADELAKAYFFLASAGLSAEQSIEALPVVTRFATAGVFDLSTATTLLADAQAALGLKTKDATQNMVNMTRVSDVLAKANTLANATIRQFSEALTNKAAAALRNINKDVEEGAATLAVFADQGIKGAVAGSALHMVLRDLQRSVLKNREVFDRFGVTVFDASGEVAHIADIIGDLERSLEDATPEMKRMAFQMLGFQDRSLNYILSLIGMSGKLREYDTALRQAGGTTKEISEKTLASFSNQVTILKNRFDELLLTVGEALMPTMKELVTQLQEVTDGLIHAEKETHNLADAYIGVVQIAKVFFIGLGGVWTILRAIASIVAHQVIAGMDILNRKWKSAIEILGVWWEALKSVGTGIGLFAKSLVGYGAVFKALLSGNIAEAERALSAMGNNQQKAMSQVGKAIAQASKEAFRIVRDDAKESLDLLKGMSADVLEDLKKQWSDFEAFVAKIDPFHLMPKPELTFDSKLWDEWEEEMFDLADATEGVGHAMHQMAEETEKAAGKGTRAIKAMMDATKDQAKQVMDMLLPAPGLKEMMMGAMGGKEMFEMLKQRQRGMIPAAMGMKEPGAGEHVHAVGMAVTEEGETEMGMTTPGMEMGDHGNKADMMIGMGMGHGTMGMGGQMLDLEAMGIGLQEAQALRMKMEIELTKTGLETLKQLNEEELQMTEEQIQRKEEMVEAYNERLRMLQLAQASIVLGSAVEIGDSLTSIAENLAGRQSGIYKAMFAMSKAFAIAEASVKIMQGIANAASLPWPANLAAMASVAAATASIVSNIQSIKLTFAGERAMGGPVEQGNVYLVGEKGPELFIPPQMGEIIPNNRIERSVLEEFLDSDTAAQSFSSNNRIERSVLKEFLDSDTTTQLFSSDNRIEKSVLKEISSQTIQSASASRELEKSVIKEILDSDTTTQLFSSDNRIERMVLSGVREKGGSVSSNRAYLVGEKGPETFVPNRSGEVIPIDQAQRGTRVVINNYTDVRPEVRERNEGGEHIIEVMLQKVKDDMASEIRDGRGSVSQAMETSFGLRRGRV